MSFRPPFLVRIWQATGTSRGRGSLVATIDDASDVGASEYANEPGECFFTIPANHPYIDQIVPLQRHIEVSRWSSSASAYVPIWGGVMDDFDADEDEVVVYGTDYLGQYEAVINPSTISYTNTAYSTIVSDRLSSTIFASIRYFPAGFLTAGTIDSTSETVTVAAPHTPVLGFLSDLLRVYQAETSVRPVIYIAPRSNPATFNFAKNRGSDVNVKLEYGTNVSAYRFRPNYRGLYYQVKAIGQRREGASILYSTQSYADYTVYGRRETAQVFMDVIDQAALDRRAKRAARRAGTPDNGIALAIMNGRLAPWDGFDIGDSITVKVQDGIVNLNGRYTVWGQEWIGRGDGSEMLFLDLSPKET